MKNLKNLLPLFALVLGFALVFTTSAFTAKTNTYWVYDGTSINDVKDASQYHEDMAAPSCASGANLPCKLETDASINDETALQTYLNTFPSNVAVRDAAIGKRN